MGGRKIFLDSDYGLVVFQSRVDKSPESGCWEWTGLRYRSGYGRFKHDRKDSQAHRISWWIANGPVPVGLELDHLCRNRLCVNPAHLEPVTHRENMRRSLSFSGLKMRQTLTFSTPTASLSNAQT
jgi:hypothetical protein